MKNKPKIVLIQRSAETEDLNYEAIPLGPGDLADKEVRKLPGANRRTKGIPMRRLSKAEQKRLSKRKPIASNSAKAQWLHIALNESNKHHKS